MDEPTKIGPPETVPLLSREERLCVAAVWACHAIGGGPNFCEEHLAALKKIADRLTERGVLYRTLGELRPGRPVREAAYAFTTSAAQGDWENKWAERIFDQDGHTFESIARLLGAPKPRPRQFSELQFCASREQLELALKDLTEAASGGFTESLAVLSLTAVGPCLGDCLASASGHVMLRGPGGQDFGYSTTPGDVVLRGQEIVYREELEGADDADV